MNLKPLRGYVLIEEIDETEVRASGLVMPETAKDKPMKGVVVASSEIFTFEGDVVPLKDGVTLTSCYSNLEGKKVVFKKWATNDLEEDGKKLAFVRFEDILGVYE
jgi:chaperonin GroES